MVCSEAVFLSGTSAESMNALVQVFVESGAWRGVRGSESGGAPHLPGPAGGMGVYLYVYVGVGGRLHRPCRKGPLRRVSHPARLCSLSLADSCSPAALLHLAKLRPLMGWLGGWDDGHGSSPLTTAPFQYCGMGRAHGQSKWMSPATYDGWTPSTSYMYPRTSFSSCTRTAW